MKKNWKKITAALLTATMLLGTGCGKKEKTEEADGFCGGRYAESADFCK